MLKISSTARRVLLAVYVFAVTLIFLYVGFPSEMLRSHVGNQLSASLSGLSVEVGGVRPALPAGIALQEVRISHGERPVAVIDRLRIQAELLSLLQSRTGYGFSGSTAGGEINGRAEIDSAGPAPKVSLTGRIGGALIQQMPALKGLYGNRLAGRLDGSFAVSESGTVTGKFSVTDGKVELATPVFAQKELQFRNMDVDISLQNRNLVVRNGRVKGNELDAEISGTIALDRPPGVNALNLSGRVSPHPEFLSQMEGSIPPNLLRRRTAIPFRVNGPLEAPGFSLN